MARTVRNAGLAWMALLLIMMLVLTACAEKAAEPTSTEQKASTENTAAKTKVVKDAYGDVEIPVKPQRVAAIYQEDFLIALGVTPVVQWYHPAWGKQDYLGLDVPLFDITGSIEALLAANPDIIIVDGYADPKKYEEFSKVAPTYKLPDELRNDTIGRLKKIAEVLGVPEKADEAIQKYNEKIADTKAKLEKAIGNETVAVIRLNVGNKPNLALFGDGNVYTGMLYKELGLTPYSAAKNQETHVVLSEEAIPAIDADHIIVFPSNGTWTSEENKDALKILESPIWKSVPAVKKGHVYPMEERTHWQSGAMLANLKKADDLVKAFVK
ncbi:ABC transporter substrate-binding protein [Brevibacillus brevis]|uniref:ABC transporter substrate-binding protein n=1 Tax=Brevibacillus brevis TaxID=1393 RepID=A0A517I1U2_BREBE|nr:ABC transporter substrate-binding protein [Brevibacillus brevis]QDS32784.1 ABC transporter substrate-binding protein [Brevibacillus brevis]